MAILNLKTRDIENIGNRNRHRVLAEIVFNGPIPRAKIAQSIGLTQASVSRIANDLIKLEFIEEGKKINHGQSGRRFINLNIKPKSYFICGITVNAFSQEVVIGDLANSMIVRRRLELNDLNDAHHVLMHATKVLNELINKNQIKPSRLINCAVTISGVIDPERCIVKIASPLNWRNIEVKKIVASQLNIPIYVDSIPNAKNITFHHFFANKGINDAVLLNLSLKIGCSLMLDGRIVRGHNHQAGLIESLKIPLEFNHKLTLLDEVSSGFAVIDTVEKPNTQLAINYPVEAKKLVDIITSAENGDNRAKIALEQAGRNLALAISTLNAILHPEVFVLSGPLIDSKAYCLGVKQRLTLLEGEEFFNKKVRCSFISNTDSVKSLAVYRSLSQGDFTHKL